MIRQMVRRLARAPMFTAVTVMTIAVAIGANAVVFSVINGVLLKPLPYQNSDRLVSVWLTAPGFNIEKLELSAADYFTFWRRRTNIPGLRGLDHRVRQHHGTRRA